MKLNKAVTGVSLALALAFAADTVMAQDGGERRQRGPGNQQAGPGGERGGRGNFDPAEMQQRFAERLKEQLEITDDNEWKALEPLVTKVNEARMATMAGRMGGARGGRGGPGGGGPGGGGGFGAAQPAPEVEALQRAIEAKASNTEMKAAVTKFVEARKAKQAELEKAQATLRKVLTPRQEAIATLNGLL